MNCNYTLSNREKRKAPKHSLVWCLGCDRYYGDENKKCPVCGNRIDKKQRRDKYSKRNNLRGTS